MPCLAFPVRPSRGLLLVLAHYPSFPITTCPYPVDVPGLAIWLILSYICIGWAHRSQILVVHEIISRNLINYAVSLIIYRSSQRSGCTLMCGNKSANGNTLLCLAVAFDWLSSVPHLKSMTAPGAFKVFINLHHAGVSILKHPSCCSNAVSRTLAVMLSWAEAYACVCFFSTSASHYCTTPAFLLLSLSQETPYARTVRAGGCQLEKRLSAWPVITYRHILDTPTHTRWTLLMLASC